MVIPWYTMVYHGRPWITVKLQWSLPCWFIRKEKHGIIMVYCGISWYTMVCDRYGNKQNISSTAYHGIPSHSGIVTYLRIAYHGMPWYTMNYFITWYFEIFLPWYTMIYLVGNNLEEKSHAYILITLEYDGRKTIWNGILG